MSWGDRTGVVNSGFIKKEKKVCVCVGGIQNTKQENAFSIRVFSSVY